MAPRPFRLLAALAFLWAPSGVLLQAAALAPGTVQLRSFVASAPLQSGLPDLALLGPTQAAVALPYLPGNLSLPIVVAGKDKLALYPRAALEKALADKAELPKPVQEFPLVPGVQSYLIVLQSRGHDGDWDYALVADDSASFPGGGLLLFNLTAYPFSGRIGTDSIQVPPKASKLFRPAFDPANPGVEVVFQTTQGGQLLPFLHQRWTMNPNMRALAVFWDFGGGDVRMSIVGDSPPPPPPRPS